MYYTTAHFHWKLYSGSLSMETTYFSKKWFLNHHVVSTIWKTETGLQYMVPAWAQANPAAQTKLERA